MTSFFPEFLKLLIRKEMNCNLENIQEYNLCLHALKIFSNILYEDFKYNNKNMLLKLYH